MRSPALFLIFAVVAVAPAWAKEEKSLCPNSSKANAKWLRECDSFRRSLREFVQELPAKEAEMGKALGDLAKKKLSQVDLDTGAQCRQAELLTQGLAQYRYVLTPLKNLDRIVKKELTNEKTRSWKTYYTQTAYPEMSRERQCAVKCRDKNCLETCGWNVEKHKTWEKDLGAQHGIPLAEGIKKEWQALYKEIDKVAPVLSAKTRDYEKKVEAFELRANEIHAQYRCKGSGIPHVPKVVEQSGSRGNSAVDTNAAPRESSPDPRPSGVSSGTSGAGTNAARDLFRTKTESPEEKVRKASTLLYTQGELASGSGFYVRTRDENGKEAYRLVTAHHVPSEEHRNDRLPGYLNLNVYGANDRPVDDIVTKAGMAMGYGADASVRYNLDSSTFDRGNDVLALPAAPGNALELAPEGELPQHGSEILITGHRGGTGNLVYTTYRCKFEGYTPNLLDTDMAYLADCPGAPDIGGMSGGAVVDARSGRVIGLVSGQNVNTNSRVIVSPLYESKNGGIRTGPQQQMVQDHCYENSGSKDAYRCSILPGYQFSTY